VKVLAWLPFPPRWRHRAGGVQTFVPDLIAGLVAAGDTVVVACPAGDRSDDLVMPPPPGGTHPVVNEYARGRLTAHDRLRDAEVFDRLAMDADVVLTADRDVPCDTDTPVVLSLNNLTYPAMLDALFGLRWDAVVVPSRYLARGVSAVVGPGRWDGQPPPVHVVPYGIDGGRFRRQLVDDAFRARYSPRDGRRLLAFPHRPEPDKGFDVALDALALLIVEDPAYTLLVPLPPDSIALARDAEQRVAHRQQERVAGLGLADHVIFHPWVDYEDMPGYLSMAEACLSVGEFPETFGLTVAQALACGTPVVATPAGALAEVHGQASQLVVVPFNDPAAVADAVRQAVRLLGTEPEPTTVRPIAFMVDGYRRALRSCRKRRARYRPAAHGQPS